MLIAENIFLKVGTKKILDDVSFEANPGEILAIIGANGAGKSSLLKVVSGDSTFQGNVTLSRKSIQSYKSKELARLRGVLTQTFSLNAPFVVEEVVMMGRYPFFNEQPTACDRQIVHQAMEYSSVVHLKDRIYTTLSGGEKQRVHLARVIAQVWSDEKIELFQPKYLFLDEPVSSLDLLHQHKTLAIASALKKMGYVVITVLHDLNLTAQYADRVLLLKEGKVIAKGLTREVLTEEHLFRAFDFPVTVMDCFDRQYPVIITNPIHDETIVEASAGLLDKRQSIL